MPDHQPESAAECRGRSRIPAPDAGRASAHRNGLPVSGRLLYVSVFLSGAVVMTFELVGSRLLAPFLGSGLVVWTSLIGVVLGALSLGYWIGGVLADSRRDSDSLGLLLMGSGLLIALTALLSEPILGWGVPAGRVELHSLLVSLVLFAPASVVLGCVSPYATRLGISGLKEAGRHIGTVYAVSTAGSILGTFAAGFFLIPWLGSTRLLFLVAGVQVLVALPFCARRWMPLLAMALVLAALTWQDSRSTDPGLLLDVDTPYSRVRVVRSRDVQGRPLNLLVDSPGGAQAASYLDSDELVFDCLRAFRLVNHILPEPRRALLIGGGGFAWPKDFLGWNPWSQMDVVEIDPAMDEIARRFFRHRSDPRVRVFHEDGRVFLNRRPGPYDVVFMDAFGTSDTIPFQLTTVEALRRVSGALVPRGVVLANLLGAPEGQGAAFLRRQVASYRQVFPRVFLFQVDPRLGTTSLQNLTLLALKDARTPFPLAAQAGEHGRVLRSALRVRPDRSLTDDHAPVEWLARQR